MRESSVYNFLFVMMLVALILYIFGAVVFWDFNIFEWDILGKIIFFMGVLFITLFITDDNDLI